MGVRVHFRNDAPCARALRWDRAALMRGLLEGHQRKELVHARERAVAELDPPDFSTSAVDAPWSQLVSTLLSAAHPFFAASGRRRDVECPDAAAISQRREALLAQRRELREAPLASSRAEEPRAELARAALDVAAVELELVLVSRRLRKLQRRAWAVRRRGLEASLADSCARRDMAEVWQLAHALARRCTGPRKRKWALPDDDKPLVADWSALLQATAPQGGLGAELISDLEDWQRQAGRMQARSPLPPLLGRHNDLAVRDVHAVRWYLRRQARKRRGGPAWSLPTEVWHMLFWPEMRRKLPTGVGAVAEPLETSEFRRRVLSILAHVRRAVTAPNYWCIAQSWDFSKRNGVRGARGRRLVHGFCPFGKGWTAGALQRGSPPPLCT